MEKFNKYLCSICTNKSENCKKLETKTNLKYISYKCINYQHKEIKKIGDYDVEEYFINKLAPVSSKQKKQSKNNNKSKNS